jgi:hypothetical protein
MTLTARSVPLGRFRKARGGLTPSLVSRGWWRLPIRPDPGGSPLRQKRWPGPCRMATPQAESLVTVAAALAAHDPDRAECIARSITHEYLRERTLVAVVVALAPSNPDGAGRIARSITHEGWKAEIFSLLE